jgi:predicted TIM-barrel fold metal-dependent hydrolase
MPFTVRLRAVLAAVSVVAVVGIVVSTAGARLSGRADDTLTVDQVMRMPKIDAHAHVNSALSAEQKAAFFTFLERENLRWLDICVVGTQWERLQKLIEVASALHAERPDRVSWATSFNLTNWSNPQWAKAAVETIAGGTSRGAVAVKVWKDIGMVLKGADGKYVMIDDPRIAPVLDAVQKQGRTLVAHIGEPRNCWLPLDQMTVQSDRNYFSKNPQYHGLLHPEVPGYEKQIAARDAMLERHPGLKVVGCHLGSLEYDVDEVAKRLDRYPNFAVDLAARLVHLQIQPRDKVRAFLLKYQDRLLYGTDEDFAQKTDAKAAETALEEMGRVYRADAAWLATDEEVPVPRAKAGFTSRGVALPASVLRKIYFENAKKWYPGI